MVETEERIRNMEKSKLDEFKWTLQWELEQVELEKKREYEWRMLEIEQEW